MQDTIFFCGAILNHDGLLKYKGETPAASLWIKGFLSGIMDNGVDVLDLAPVWDNLFLKVFIACDPTNLASTITQIYLLTVLLRVIQQKL
jgi:hypothetical protein